jgi:outer membrane receptor protein involved in Fe transport
MFATRFLVVLLAAFPVATVAQTPVATLRVQVTHEGAPAPSVLVRAGRVGAQTDARGTTVLTLAEGTHTVVATRIGLASDSVTLTLRAGADTTIRISLASAVEEIEAVVISSTRGERRIEDEPVRVEVIEREEVDEKLLMTPGDIAMLLNETSGLRVQTTSPSLGGATVRIQGLAGRYTQILSDGLPLYGGQAGGLGLLQIPPMDLGSVEVIKGAASALYGAQALGGVVNLISRRPGEAREREILLNRTSRSGTPTSSTGDVAGRNDRGRHRSARGTRAPPAVERRGDGCHRAQSPTRALTQI